MILQPKSLQQRTLFFILVPTLVLLISLSVGGFLFVRDMLLRQWGETAVVKLQRTAHLIDMELRRPKELLLLLQGNENVAVSRQVLSYAVHEIEALEMVVGVKVDWPDERLTQLTMTGQGMQQMMESMHRYRLQKFEISSPQYNSKQNDRTVSLVSEIKNNSEATIGRVEVIISFEDLIEEIIGASWWKSNKAYLLDRDGNVLVSTALQFELENYFPMRVFGTINALEKETLKAIREQDSGTVFGAGYPPKEISGFYHLTEAPWTMVIMAPGDQVLQPIIRFKFFYFFTFAGCILLILIFIRQATDRLTFRIKEVSARADDLAKGTFGPPIRITARDEVSDLAKSFNKMSLQLQQRLTMKREINIAREVQQNLLPRECFTADGVVACGISLYCDETGGDYFDLISFPDNDRKLAVVVGDVVGHGIGAALLMTTVRALLRCRISQAGRPDQIMADVNRLLWKDTSISGNFVTLFYLEVDQEEKTMQWVRAGHDPAIGYSPVSGEFTELMGNGLTLGVDPEWIYEYNQLPVPEEGQVILISSDGAWEVENSDGKRFGKERIRQILSANSDLHPKEILQRYVDEIAAFRGETPQNDDITLVVLKTS